jgi:hypothetical protein
MAKPISGSPGQSGGKKDLVALSVNDTSITEGESLVYTVSLDKASTSSVSVSFATSNGTAGAGDYTGRNGALTFAPGELTKTIIVNTANDTAYEPNESVFVTLSKASNARIADGLGSGTIIDNDAPAPPPPTGSKPAEINLVLRGQSNAQIFGASGAIYDLESRVESATGAKVNVVAAWDQPNSTIYSGTEFLTEWMNGTQAGPLEQGFLNYMNGLPDAQEALPTITLWMHNESDQKRSPSASTWTTAAQADAALVRDALGQGAGTTPYLYVPIRYPYGDPTGIFTAMDHLDANQSFNARVSRDALASEILMDGGSEPGINSSHMSWGDAFRLSQKLVDDVVAVYNQDLVL